MIGTKPDPMRATAIRQLKQLARELFEAAEDDAIVVNELKCTEPGCPPVETVIALLRAGQPPRQVKVHKAVVDVTDADLRHAMTAGHAHD